jgi:hypothetical protein
MSRNQLNIRVSDELETLIDKKRIELASTMKVIPTRSDVVRYALQDYLGVVLPEVDQDLRTTSKVKKGLLPTLLVNENE